MSAAGIPQIGYVAITNEELNSKNIYPLSGGIVFDYGSCTAMLASQGHKKLVLNLEAVPYIDSAGLGEIVRTYTSISRQGGKLKLLNVSKRIYDLLVITKLYTVFEVKEDEKDAIASFK